MGKNILFFFVQNFLPPLVLGESLVDSHRFFPPSKMVGCCLFPVGDFFLLPDVRNAVRRKKKRKRVFFGGHKIVLTFVSQLFFPSGFQGETRKHIRS